MNRNISIVMLMKDAAGYLAELVPALLRQSIEADMELVVIDSGSTDESVELLQSLCEGVGLNLSLASVEPSDFGHGRTRNAAVGMATGDIVVMLSQDAIPISDTWLSYLVLPLSDERVAGAFGRQVARPGASLCESLFYELTYPAEARVMEGRDASSFSNLGLFFSNVNGAMRRPLAIDFPFRDDLVMSEDQFWGRAVLRYGYSIAYQPDAAVLHSHNYNLTRLFKRYYQSGYSLRQIDLQGEVVRGGASSNLKLLKRVAVLSPRDLPYSVLYQAVQGLSWLSGRYDLLPSSLRRRLLS